MCFALPQTVHDFPCARNGCRSDPKQSRTAGGKRAVAATTHHLAPTNQTTSVQKDGSVSPGAPGKDGPDLETAALPASARDASPVPPRAFPSVLEAQIQSACKKAE